jgi:class 3 adenylate cyclase
VRTFLIADVRGYTRFTREHGDEAAADLAMRFAGIARECVLACDGEVVGLRGDELAAAFGSPRLALQAAVIFQRRLADEVRADPSRPLLVGIGVDAGESVAVEDGYRGAALNLAARLCSLAKAGEVLVSDTVEHLAGRQPEITFKDRGRRRVKGIEHPVHLYQAVFPLDLPKLRSATPRWTRTRLAVVAAAVVVVVVAGVAVAARGGHHTLAAVPVRANSLAEIDVKSGRVVGDVHLLSQPSVVVSGGGSLWVAEEHLDTVVRVNPTTLKSVPDGIGIDPEALAYGVGSLWAYDPVGMQAARIDPNLIQDPTPATFALPPCPKPPRSAGEFYGCQLGGIAVIDGSVFIGRAIKGDVNDLGVLWEFDAHNPTPTLTATIPDVPATEIVAGAGSLWTAGTWVASLVEQINPDTRKRIGPWNVPGGLNYGAPFGMTWFANYAWVVSATPVLAPLGPSDAPAVSGDNVPLSPGSTEVVGGGGYLWVTNDDGTLVKIDPNTRKVVRTYPLGHPASGVAYTKNHVWVAVT